MTTNGEYERDRRDAAALRLRLRESRRLQSELQRIIDADECWLA